jgi:hypothetical protein
MTGYNYNKLHIFGLGDFVSGNIHDELNYEGIPITDQTILVGELISELIHKWSSRFKEIELTGITGNHGRTTKKPEYKRGWSGWDYMALKWIEIKCENLNNVTFNIPKSLFALQTIYKWNFLIFHGQNIKSYMGIPHYGIQRTNANLTQTLAYEKNFYPHYMVLGHFHNPNILAKIGGNIIINGSIKGTDEYAYGKMFVSGKPSQKLLSVHKDRGITWSMDIDLI